MIHALLPAAGRSQRMGVPKLLLPLGGQTVLERCIAAFRQADVERILVVAPPEPSAIADTARQAGVSVLHLTEPTSDMQATVQAGLRWMAAHWQPRPDDAWLLAPADHPVLDPDVVRLLCREFGSTHASILVPTFENRRGHPVLLAWSHAAAVLGLPSGTGIHRYIREQASEVREISVASPAILTDLDTPEDYQRLLREQSSPEIHPFPPKPFTL